jgi:hypothetical protein
MTQDTQEQVVVAKGEDIELGLDEVKDMLLKSDGASERFKAMVEAGVVNPIELAKAMDVRPQMLYNYIRNGRLQARLTADTQKFVIDLDVALKFAQRYIGKQLAKQAQIERELRGE